VYAARLRMATHTFTVCVVGVYNPMLPYQSQDQVIMTNSELPPRLVSVRQAAALLCIGLTKTYELIAEGLLETVNIGSRRPVTLRSIDALIDSAANGQAA